MRFGLHLYGLITVIGVGACLDAKDGARRDSVNHRIAEAHCQALIACPLVQDYDIDGLMARDSGVEGCADFIARQIETWFGVDFDALIASGDFAVDEAKLEVALQRYVSFC